MLGFAANELGHELYIVGGFVRNQVLGHFIKIDDIDLVINTNAINFIHQFAKYYEDNHPKHHCLKILETYEQFGIIKIACPDSPAIQIEIASARQETYMEPAILPKVHFVRDIKLDLPRRDFTINALLISLNKNSFGECIDHIGAFKDIQNRLIRVFHDMSFIDDPTRIYRAVRFMFEYDFDLENHTKELLLSSFHNLNFSTWHRKRYKRFEIELNYIKALPNSSKALAYLQNLGLSSTES